MKYIFISILITLSGCNFFGGIKEESLIYGEGEMFHSWKQNTLNKCKFESAVLTIAKYEMHPYMTKEDVEKYSTYLFHSCLKYYNMFI